MRLRWVPVFCVVLGLASTASAKLSGVLDGPVLEARWQDYAQDAAQTRPALDFPYADCFRQAATLHDLPETLLLAVARGESDFNPTARSKADAYGLMQILWPGTAKHLGLDSLSDLLDPCTNVEAGARYLKELLGIYGGNLHRSLAAYNYGPARIPKSGDKLPRGAVWYSGYIMRHLDYVLKGSSKVRPGAGRAPYKDQGRLFIVHFSRPYRAAAFIGSLQPRFGEIRLDWFRHPEGGFDVVMVYAGKDELKRGQQLLREMGLG
jgi:hypothetical protein